MNLEEIKESLIERIRIGTYVSGQRLYISALAEDYNVSTMEIRAIIRVLLYERVLVCRLEGDITVCEHRLTRQRRIAFYHFFRRALESLGESQWQQLEEQQAVQQEILVQMAVLLKRKEYPVYHQAKVSFLLGLSVGMNPLDQEMLEQELKRWCYFHLPFYEDDPNRLDQDYTHYLVLQEAIGKRNREGLYKSLQTILV